MRIAYSCIGRAWNLDPKNASTVGGDLDRARMLMRLAWEYPEHEFLLVGRNSGEDPVSLGYPDNVKNPWHNTDFKMPTLSYEAINSGGRAFYDEYIWHWRAFQTTLSKIDAHIMWMGQHGGSNSPLPFVDTEWADNNLTHPQQAFVTYCAYLLEYCNFTWHVDPLFICPDPRNYWKARELKTPIIRPVLAQYQMNRITKFEQYGDWLDGSIADSLRKRRPGHREASNWVIDLSYEYAGIELTALDHPVDIPVNETPGDIDFGMVSNENRKEVTNSRLELVKKVRDALGCGFQLYGSWTPASLTILEQLGVGPCLPIDAHKMYETIRRFRSTVTLPASGSGWATAKPWECFATGVVCFFHPKYDTQGWIIPARPGDTSYWRGTDTPEIAEFAEELAHHLRYKDEADLAERVAYLAADDDLWYEITELQRNYFDKAFRYWNGGVRTVEEALAL